VQLEPPAPLRPSGWWDVRLVTWRAALFSPPFWARYTRNMTSFSTSVTILAPAERAWSVMSDIERWHEWTPTIRSIRRRDAGPLRVGSRAIIRQPRLPPALWTVTDLQPGRSFTWVSRAPGIRVTAHHQVEAGDGESRAALSLAFTGPLGPLFGWLTRRINERYLALEAAGLKRRSEQRDPNGPVSAGGRHD
jgi:uncharacterized membrane protein